MKQETKVHYLKLEMDISEKVAQEAKANRRSVSSELAVLIETGMKWREANERQI